MRRGLGAPGAPDERRRKPGTNRACVLLLGRNRHESDLFVQQGRHWEPLSTHAEHRLRFRWVTSFFTCEFSLTPSPLPFSFFHFLPVTLHLSRPPILWLVPPFLKQRIVPTIHAINRIENFKLKIVKRKCRVEEISRSFLVTCQISKIKIFFVFPRLKIAWPRGKKDNDTGFVDRESRLITILIVENTKEKRIGWYQWR